MGLEGNTDRVGIRAIDEVRVRVRGKLRVKVVVGVWVNQDKPRQAKPRQDKARQDKSRQAKPSQD